MWYLSNSTTNNIFRENDNQSGIQKSYLKSTSHNESNNSSKISNTEIDLKDNILSFPNLLYHQTTSIFSIGKKDLPYIALAGGITVGLIALDGRIDKGVKNLKRQSNVINTSSPYLTELGGKYGLIGTGLFAGFSIITGNKKGMQTSLFAFESAITAGLWTRLGKLIAGRERPSASYEYSKHNSGIWKGPVNQIKNKDKRSISSYDAFPSGHTSMAFAIATVFAQQYNHNLVVPIISYSFASIVGVTRMIEHTHWASDVFVGAIIGYLCGKSTVYFNTTHSKSIDEKKIKFAIQPSVSNSIYGVNANLSF